MDTAKLIDAIAQADRVEFDKMIAQAKEDAKQIAEDYLTLATVNAILQHSGRCEYSQGPWARTKGIRILFNDSLNMAIDELFNLYPEVKDLL
jgi:hypothetical protein